MKNFLNGFYCWHLMNKIIITWIKWIPTSNFRHKLTNLPCPSTGPQMFCAGPNILGQTKNWILGPSKKFCTGTKTEFTLWKSSFGLVQKVVNQFLVWHKIFGPAQNVLGHVKEQGIPGKIEAPLPNLPPSCNLKREEAAGLDLFSNWNP